MLSVKNESLIRFTGEKFASDKEADRVLAGDFLDLLLDEDEPGTVLLLEEQLKLDDNAARRQGYVLALKESFSPSAVIILMRALQYEQDPTVWQAILAALSELQPTRPVLENLTVTGIDFGIREEAAQMLLDLARRDERAMPKSTAEGLLSFLGSSESVSYPTEGVLAASGKVPADTLTMALMNSSSIYHAQQIFQNTHPDDSWKRLLYPSITLPQHCDIGTTTNMLVQLVMTAEDGELQPVNVDFKPGESEVNLQVMVTSKELTVNQNWQTITVLPAGNSTTATFPVVPRQEGRANLTVEFFKEGQRIGLLMVRTFVSDPNVQSDDGTGEDIYDQEIDRWLRQQVISLENPILHMHEKTEGLTFLAHLRSSPNPGDHVEWIDPAAGDYSSELSSAAGEWQNPDRYFDDFRDDTAKVLDVTSKLEAKIGRSKIRGNDKVLMNDPLYQKYQENLEYMLLNLEAVGKDLYADVVAPGIRERVAEIEEGTPLQFGCDAKLAWLPWELVYDEDRGAFWGELFPITRLAEPLSDAQRHRQEGVARDSVAPQIINIAGDQLGNLVKLIEKLFKELPTQGNISPFKVYSLGEFVNSVSAGKVVHLTCLGERDSNDIYYLRLGPERIHRFKSRNINNIDFSLQPLVFTNACSTTSSFMTLQGYSNFAWRVYKRGAGAYIGTIAPVPAIQAVLFAETLYENLLEKQQTASEALWQTKRAFSKMEPRHPFYLLYCLYGNSQWCWPASGELVEPRRRNL